MSLVPFSKRFVCSKTEISTIAQNYRQFYFKHYCDEASENSVMTGMNDLRHLCLECDIFRVLFKTVPIRSETGKVLKDCCL